MWLGCVVVWNDAKKLRHTFAITNLQIGNFDEVSKTFFGLFPALVVISATFSRIFYTKFPKNVGHSKKHFYSQSRLELNRKVASFETGQELWGL